METKVLLDFVLFQIWASELTGFEILLKLSPTKPLFILCIFLYNMRVLFSFNYLLIRSYFSAYYGPLHNRPLLKHDTYSWSSSLILQLHSRTCTLEPEACQTIKLTSNFVIIITATYHSIIIKWNQR